MVQSYYYSIPYYLLGALLAALGIIGYMIRARKADRERIQAKAKDDVWDGLRRSFISDVATNHLPHIQACLELIAEKLGIDLPEPPPIRYMPFDPRDGR